jgi:hypothetical protein
MSNYVGGVISSAFFDTTSYSPQWVTDNAVQLTSVLEKTVTLPNALEYFSSILYNQGPGSIAQAFFGSDLNYCATHDYVGEQRDIRFDGQCFLTSGTGQWYPFQLPDVNHNYLEQAPTKLTGGYFYHTTLNWSEISAFLDLIGPSYYGFYDQYDITQARIAAHAAFIQVAGSGTTIDFQTQFPIVLDAIMQSLPVYLTGVDLSGGPGAGIQVANNSSQYEYYVQSSQFNNTIMPGTSVNILAGSFATSLQYQQHQHHGLTYARCSDAALATFNTLLQDSTVKKINLDFNAGCLVTKG